MDPGLATGDAFGECFFHGYARQWVARRRIPDPAWHWTDDTAMALAICDQLLQQGRIFQDQLAGRFGERFDPGRRFGPGMRRLLPLLRDGVDWREAGANLYKGGSFGNGSAMRVAPLGAFFAEDPELAAHEAELSAVITHAHPEGVAGAIATATAASFAGAGHEGGPALLREVSRLTPESVVRTGIQAALEIGEPNEAAATLGTGRKFSAQDTVPWCVWVASRHLDDYEEAIWETVAGLGDRDTTCAIVGGIVAAKVGRAGIPDVWLRVREALPTWVEARRRAAEGC